MLGVATLPKKAAPKGVSLWRGDRTSERKEGAEQRQGVQDYVYFRVEVLRSAEERCPHSLLTAVHVHKTVTHNFASLQHP